MTWVEILAAYPFLQPILDTLKPVIGDAYHLLLSGIRAKQKARELLTMTNAAVEAQRSAPHASLSYQQGDWSITLPGQHPSAFSLPPASEMRLRLDQHRYETLGERWRKPRSNYGTKRVSLRSVPIKIGWLGISNPQARLPIRPCKSFGENLGGRNPETWHIFPQDSSCCFEHIASRSKTVRSVRETRRPLEVVWIYSYGIKR